VKYFGALDDGVAAVVVSAGRVVVVVVVVLWLEVMPGGGGGAAGLVVLVVWARTGHAITAVAAIMVPIDACLDMVDVSLWDSNRTASTHCGLRSVRPQKNVCASAHWQSS
jgi:hypothetical protein